jgi:hypothetical protein
MHEPAEAHSPYGPPPGGGGGPQGWGNPPGYGTPPPAPPGGYGPPGFMPPPVGSYGVPPPGAFAPRVDGMAITGLILGVIGILIGFVNLLSGFLGTFCVICTVGSTFIGVIGLIPSGTGVALGVMGEKRIRTNPGRFTGRGVAIAAIVVSGLATLVALVEIILPWLGIGCLHFSGALSP